ncbi:MAG: hypothetical protein VX555_00890 [Pseudomonadota bacterium]|nr:hypothetical protein [Pseudomonadota bacterium]
MVRFGLATGELAPVMALSDDLEGESSPFLRARVLLQSGKTEQGLALLEDVTAGQYHRSEASLLLGRHYVANGQPDVAKDWFQQVIRTGFGDARQEAAYRLAELEMQAGQHDRAGKILAGMEPGFWSAMGYLNLSGEHARADLNPARALVALRVALAMAGADPQAERQQDLKNRLQLRAGYLALENQEFDKAIGFLEKVSLESDSTPHALYLHGLALAEKGNHRASMQSWHRTKKFPLAFPGVTEAWIAMGRGFDLSGYLGQAGEAYLAANAAFESERVTLRKLVTLIEQEGAYKSLVKDARGSDQEWFLADNRTLTQPRMAYLLDFLRRPEAQKAVGRVAELNQFLNTLMQQRARLEFLMDSVRDQIATLDAGANARLARLLQQQQTLESELSDVSGDRQGGRGQDPLVVALQNTLSDNAGRLRQLPQRLEIRPVQLRSHLAHIKRVNAEAANLATQVRDLITQAEAILDRQALAYVVGKDAEMAAALDKTEQQIAHLYEYLALQNIEEGRQ